jgi:hypothetical protein
MKIRTLLIASAAASLIAGAGTAFAAADDDQGAPDESYQDQPNAPDQSMSDQGYSQHWFSSTGYGPNDEQADETRALNREQVERAGEVNDRDRDRDDMGDRQGPSDDEGPADDDDDRGPPPDER